MIRRRGGFTLVEMLVVVGVIVFLVGLTVTAVSAAIEGANRRTTRQTLRLLDMAVEQWQGQADRRLTWWNYEPMDPMDQWPLTDVHGNTNEVLIITEILEVIMRTPSARDIVLQIDPQYIHTYQAGKYPPWLDEPVAQRQMDDRFDGAITVLDAWGTPIYATHPGREPRPGNPDPADVPVDADGTITTYNETFYGAARNRRICFVSAGPDRAFGVISADLDSDEYAPVLDNLYSYEVDYPGAY